MKILIIGPLGSGKSHLAYAVNKKLGLHRLNIDETYLYVNGTFMLRSDTLIKL